MWQDNRTKAAVETWNNSFMLKTLKKGSGILHTITGSQRFKAGYALRFMTQSVSTVKLFYDRSTNWMSDFIN